MNNMNWILEKVKKIKQDWKRNREFKKKITELKRRDPFIYKH